jgi:hypothetical protein
MNRLWTTLCVFAAIAAGVLSTRQAVAENRVWFEARPASSNAGILIQGGPGVNPQVYYGMAGGDMPRWDFDMMFSNDIADVPIISWAMDFSADAPMGLIAAEQFTYHVPTPTFTGHVGPVILGLSPGMIVRDSNAHDTDFVGYTGALSGGPYLLATFRISVPDWQWYQANEWIQAFSGNMEWVDVNFNYPTLTVGSNPPVFEGGAAGSDLGLAINIREIPEPAAIWLLAPAIAWMSMRLRGPSKETGSVQERNLRTTQATQPNHQLKRRLQVAGSLGTLTLAALIGFSAVAKADPPQDSALSLSPIEAGPLEWSAAAERAFTGTGFELFEGFGLGAISNVMGWRCLGAEVPFPPLGDGPRCPGTLDGSNVFRNPDGSLAGVVAAGSQSAQSLFLNQNLRYPHNTDVGAVTPAFLRSPFPNYFGMDVRIDDNGGANYELVPRSSGQGADTYHVIFAYSGYIYALDNPGGTPQFVSIGHWPADTWFRFQFSYDFGMQWVDYYMGPDFDQLTRLYRGALFGANSVDELLLFSNNLQDVGLGTFSGEPRGPGAYVDNIGVPEAGTLALLCIGATEVLRRRRRGSG